MRALPGDKRAAKSQGHRALSVKFESSARRGGAAGLRHGGLGRGAGFYRGQLQLAREILGTRYGTGKNYFSGGRSGGSRKWGRPGQGSEGGVSDIRKPDLAGYRIIAVQGHAARAGDIG